MNNKLKSYFIENYINSTTPIDNEIFEHCSSEILEEIEDKFSQKNDPQSIKISLDKNIQSAFEQTIKYSKGELGKIVVARTLINSLILKSLLTKNTEASLSNKSHAESNIFVNKGIDATLGGNYFIAQNYYFNAPDIHEIYEVLNKSNIKEIVITEKDIDNRHIQIAINGYISSRLPQSIKVFTNRENLCTYYTEGGQLIEPIHDYRDQRINYFIDLDQDQLL